MARDPYPLGFRVDNAGNAIDNLDDGVSIWECQRCASRFLQRPMFGTHWTPMNWTPRLYCHGDVVERTATFDPEAVASRRERQ